MSGELAARRGGGGRPGGFVRGQLCRDPRPQCLSPGAEAAAGGTRARGREGGTHRGGESGPVRPGSGGMAGGRATLESGRPGEPSRRWRRRARRDWTWGPQLRVEPPAPAASRDSLRREKVRSGPVQSPGTRRHCPWCPSSCLLLSYKFSMFLCLLPSILPLFLSSSPHPHSLFPPVYFLSSSFLILSVSLPIALSSTQPPRLLPLSHLEADFLPVVSLSPLRTHPSTLPFLSGLRICQSLAVFGLFDTEKILWKLSGVMPYSF